MTLTSENPMVKTTINETLHELVNSMLYLVDTMPSLVSTNEDDEHIVNMSMQHFNGFKNNLDVIRAATETAYTQYSVERTEYNNKLAELEQKLAEPLAEPLAEKQNQQH